MTRKIRFMETILRDGQQSQIATRMPIEDMLPVLGDLDAAGFYALECWGGATFDACLRYLNEDPWERLRTIREHVKNTKLQMLLRGQNLLGYHNYPDKKSVENGIDVLRIFDALNDTRNLKTSIRAAKEAGGEVQAAISYTTSDVHTVRYFTQLAIEMERAGADSICIKDMAGVLTPDVATELVTEIKGSVDIPLQIHTHGTAGIAQMTLLKAVEAGADIIDTCLSPFAEGTSQPATESMAIALDALDMLENSGIMSHAEGWEKYLRLKTLYSGMSTDSAYLVSALEGYGTTTTEKFYEVTPGNSHLRPFTNFLVEKIGNNIPGLWPEKDRPQVITNIEGAQGVEL